MNEPKPEDVMRALECCAVYANCNGCPHFDAYPEADCHYKVMLNALALLREKDAQISALQYQADFWDKHAKVLDETISIQQKEIAEKDAEIERLTQERDDARSDCAVAEQNHYECKKELEEMSDDILDSVRAERDRYKAESKQYQSAFLKLKKFYSHLKGNTASGSVEYHIDQIEKELKGEKNNDHQN